MKRFRLFNPPCPCCYECYRNLAIICIYDESENIYTLGTQYERDLERWTDLIEGLEDSFVVMGIIQPQGTRIKLESAPYPHDSIGQILHQQLPSQSPRVKAEDIYEFFEMLVQDLKINLLVFCLDNSGSIVVGNYLAELNAAKALIEENYPKVKILDDISNAGERWLSDATNSAEGRTCG